MNRRQIYFVIMSRYWLFFKLYLLIFIIIIFLFIYFFATPSKQSINGLSGLLLCTNTSLVYVILSYTQIMLLPWRFLKLYIYDICTCIIIIDIIIMVDY